MEEKTARLDRDALLGVDSGHGLWQRRLVEIGGIKPLAFGLWAVRGDGARSRSPSLAWRNGGRMRWRIDISSKTARRQPVGVQLFHLRQRWGAAVWVLEGANAGPPQSAEVRSARLG